MRLNTQYLGFLFTALMLLFVISATQVSAEDMAKSDQQASHGVSPDDTVCKKGFERVWQNDGTLICVEPENVLKLVESGWLSPETVDKISISNKRAHEVSENVYAFQFDYCAAVYNEDALGIIISSDTEKIPIPIDPNIQMNQCQQYGTQIRAFSDSSLDTSIFYEKDIQSLLKSFDKKKGNLEDDLVHYQQKLLRLENPNLNEDNLEEIDRLKMRIELVNHVIESYKEDLNTLRTLQ